MNADRSCPFIDIGSVIERYEKDGLPIALSFMTPMMEYHHPDSFIEFKNQDEEGEKMAAETHAAILMIHLARTFGMPIWENAGLDFDVFEALRLAGSRSMEAQSIRNNQQ